MGKSEFDPSISDNEKSLAQFIVNVRAANERSAIERIVVTGYASPDGTPGINKRLSRERSRVVADMLHVNAGVDTALIETIAPGINWVELRELVAQRVDVPCREAVLDIIDNTPIWIFNSRGRIIGGRKKRLMDLKGGRPYRWMLTNLFPQLRSSVAVMLYLNDEADNVAGDFPLQSDTVNVVEVDEVLPPNEYDFVAVDSVHVPTVKVWYENEIRQNFALKTNLLYYAALMPNLELEWRFDDRWSALAAGNIAWYSQKSTHKTYRLAIATLELRHWIRSKERWSGWYVGPMVGGGLYDFDFGHRYGYEGEGVMVGLSGGYMWRIGNNLVLETGIGLGWMRTRYKKYTHADGHFPYLHTTSMDYFGPISLKVSLGWRFDHVVSKTRREAVL